MSIMCGRYAAAMDPAALAEEFELVVPRERSLEADYNIAPTKEAYIVVDRAVDDHRERSLEVARWGLVPSWAKDPAVGSRMINARAETIEEKPSFRAAFARRRCIVPADGYYEWFTTPQVSPKTRPAKQPFFIRDSAGAGLAMAGIYEWWRHAAPDTESDQGAEPEPWLLTFSVITVASAGPIAHIHDRMPAIIAREDIAAWLDPSSPMDDVRHALLAGNGEGLEAVQVSTMVNNVRNNGPGLLEPVMAQ